MTTKFSASSPWYTEMGGVPADTESNPRDRLVLASLFCLVLLTSPAAALTLHRIGSGPEPATSAGLIEYAWSDLDQTGLGASNGISTTGAGILPVVMAAGVNIAPRLLDEKRFLVWTGGIWVPSRSVHTTRDERWSFWMVDGDTSTVYQDTRGLKYLLDLGTHLHLSRLRFFVPDGSNSIVPEFNVGVDDGNQRLNGFRDIRLGEFDFDVVHARPGEREVDIDLQSTRVRRLLFEIVPKDLPTGEVTAGVLARGASRQTLWEISELEIYASGFASLSSYTSDVIDLGAPANLGPATWAGQVPEETAVEVRVRGGDDPDPNIYWRQTFRGVEQVTYDSDGRTLDRNAYEGLELTEMGDITHDLANWDPWSAPAPIAGERDTQFRSSGRPRRYVQFEVSFTSTPSAAASVQYVQLPASPRFVSEAIAEVDPPAAPSDREQVFRYLLRPRWEPGDPGFDVIELHTTARMVGVDAVVINTPAGADTLAAGSGWQLSPLDGTGFAVYLEDPIDSVDESLELIEIIFRAQVYAYGTPFEGSLGHRTFPDEVPQPIVDGNAHELADGNSTRVALSRIPRRPIQQMLVTPRTFSPNGDGVNDRARVEYEIVNVDGSGPVELHVYGLAGQRVRTLRADGDLTNGRAELEWDGRGEGGRMVPPGLYVLKLLMRADSADDHQQQIVAVVY